MYKAPEQYLDSDTAASRIMAHARLLLKLSRRFEAIAPGALARAARVANYKAGIVILHADNGAVAAKLRQMSQRLAAELSKAGIECSSLDVKVQPRRFAEGTPGGTVKPLSVNAVGTLRTTAETLPQGPLRQAIDQLLQRAAKTG